MRTYKTRKTMYGYDKIPAGGQRFWEVPQRTASSIARCVRYYAKRYSIPLVAKLTDTGVLVFHMGVKE
jgi:hypothetical protein